MPVDLGDIPGSADRWQGAYDSGVRAMQRALDRAAAEERGGHAYQNRTGDLEASTRASEVISVGDTDMVILAADTPYASYVAARGLMRIDEIAEQAGDELAYLFDSLDKTARL